MQIQEYLLNVRAIISNSTNGFRNIAVLQQTCSITEYRQRLATISAPTFWIVLIPFRLLRYFFFFWITIIVSLAIFLPISGITYISNGVSENIAILPLLRCGPISCDIPLESIGYVPSINSGYNERSCNDTNIKVASGINLKN